jgi:hypothetical protein
VPGADESRRFDEIVAPLREEAHVAAPPVARSRRLFIAGVVCCLAAAALFLFGRVTGAVLAVIPWLAGMTLVVLSRGRR